MFNISKEPLERLRKEYPAGARVELVHMKTRITRNCFRGREGRSFRWMILELFTYGGIAVRCSVWFMVKTAAVS